MRMRHQRGLAFGEKLLSLLRRAIGRVAHLRQKLADFLVILLQQVENGHGCVLPFRGQYDCVHFRKRRALPFVPPAVLAGFTDRA